MIFLCLLVCYTPKREISYPRNSDYSHFRVSLRPTPRTVGEASRGVASVADIYHPPPKALEPLFPLVDTTLFYLF